MSNKTLLQFAGYNNRREAVSDFFFLSQTVHFLKKKHMSTQNDNPNDGWQLSAASEKASPSGRGNAILLMSRGDEARGGSASRRCKFHL